MSKGTRKTIYIRQHDRWLLNAIKQLLKDCDEVGVRCTESDVVCSALRSYLEKYNKSPSVKVNVQAVPEGLKKTVTCPANKSWLFDRVNDLVRIKQSGGVNTSFSYELCQLAISGLTSTEGYGKICRDAIQRCKEL